MSPSEEIDGLVKSKDDGLFQRIFPRSERELFSQFVDAVVGEETTLTDELREELLDLFIQWREPYRSSDAGLPNYDVSEVDENGFAKRFTLQEALEDLDENKATALIKVGIEGLSRLNARFGHSNSDAILGVFKLKIRNRLFTKFFPNEPPESISQEERAEFDTALTMMAAGPAVLVMLNLPAEMVASDGAHSFWEELALDFSEDLVRACDLVKHDLQRTSELTTQQLEVLDQAKVEHELIDISNYESMQAQISGLDELEAEQVMPIGETAKPKPLSGYAAARRGSLIRQALKFGGSEVAVTELFDRIGAIPRDRITGGFDRGIARQAYLEHAQANAPDGYKAFYAEIDIRNLGGLNKAIGRKAADQIFGEIASLTRMKLEASGFEGEMVRFGGDEICFVGYVQEGSIDQLHGAANDVPKAIQDYVDALEPFGDVVVGEIEHHRDSSRPSGIGAVIAGQVVNASETVGSVLKWVDKTIEGLKKSQDSKAAFRSQGPIAFGRSLPTGSLGVNGKVHRPGTSPEIKPRDLGPRFFC